MTRGHKRDLRVALTAPWCLFIPHPSSGPVPSVCCAAMSLDQTHLWSRAQMLLPSFLTVSCINTTPALQSHWANHCSKNKTKNKKACAYILLASFSCSALCFTTWKMNLPRSHSFPLIPECSRTVISSTWKADSSVKLYWQALEPGQSCSCLAKWKFDTLTANKIHKLNNKKRWRGSTSKLQFLIC